MKHIVQNTAHCQVRTVKYNDRDYRVQKDRNGFEYIKVSELGKRKIIALSALEPNDEVFNYIFNYGFRDNPNPRLDALASERIYRKPKPEKTISIFVKFKNGEVKAFEIPATNNPQEWVMKQNFDYKYYRFSK